MKTNQINVVFPTKFYPAFEPMRYKVFYGGRGGGKSWSIAKALLIIGLQQKIRILCAREFQNSITESVHKLLSDKIADMEIDDFYEIQNTTIIGKNGTEFIFTGLRHNANKLKSFENIGIVWIEEAQNVTRNSWDILIPTIRAENSEIWVSFNPEFETDETYQRFIVNPPVNSTIIRMNWNDNPFFPPVLKQEMESLKARDMDAYLSVWEGHCRQTLEGAIYAKELREATLADRITAVPYSPTFPVSVFADLGWADNTSLWFVQKIGFEYRVIRAYQNRQEMWQHYLQYMQSLGYMYDTIFLPHDARAKSLGTGKSIEEITKKMGYNVRIVPNLSVEDGINAVRSIFPACFFDEKLCSDGLQALRRYRYDVDPEDSTWSRKPLHDESSHFADALRYFAVGMRELPRKDAPVLGQNKRRITLSLNAPSAGWMRQ